MTDKNRINLTESQLASLICNALNEKFNRDSMKQAVKAGGGVSKNYGIDARDNAVKSSIADKEAVGRLSAEVMSELYSANVSFGRPLDQQLIKCNDGSAIVIDPYGIDDDYTRKITKRQANYYDDMGHGKKADKWAKREEYDSSAHAIRRYKRRKENQPKKDRQ